MINTNGVFWLRIENLRRFSSAGWTVQDAAPKQAVRNAFFLIVPMDNLGAICQVERNHGKGFRPR